MKEALGIPDDEPTPALPGRGKLRPIQELQAQNGHADTKRKQPDGDTEMADTENETSTELAKRAKSDGTAVNGSEKSSTDSNTDDAVMRGAQAAAALIPFLSAEDLLPPKLPTKDEMEKVLLDLRKKALVEEYFGE